MARASRAARVRQPSGLVAAFWLGSLVALTAVWVLGLLVPYYVNDLDRLPLEEVASGAHDPKDLWPYAGGGTAPGLLRAALLVLALPLLPLVTLGSLGLGSAILVRRRAGMTPGARRLTWAVVILAGAMAAVSLSPFGLYLSAWALD